MKPAPPWLRYPQVTLILTALLFGWGVWALVSMPRREPIASVLGMTAQEPEL